MTRMFHGASVFNQDIESWDVSRVTVITSMFHGASVFHQYIGSWDVSRVTSMHTMFGERLLSIKMVDVGISLGWPARQACLEKFHPRGWFPSISMA
jgi:surface protein